MASEWLPIESAPRTGERLNLWRCGDAVYGFWNRDEYAKKPRPYWSHDQERLFGTRDARENPPTHWQPLPPPPREG